MKRTIQHPTARERKDSLGGTDYTHPAFAQIAASRCSGGDAILYGSEFKHHHYMTLRIHRSVLNRSLSRDWAHDEGVPYIEIAMSESQWASFVSSPNMGSGIQCTLLALQGKTIPSLPPPEPRSKQFAQELKAQHQEALDTLKELEKTLAGVALSGVKREALTKMVERVRRQLLGNSEFVASQFEGHMEAVTAAAKTEVDAYAHQTLMSAGLSAVRVSGSGTEIVLLPGETEPQPRVVTRARKS